MQSNYQVKMSKKMVIMACISAGIFELLFLGLSVSFICDYFFLKNITYDEEAAFYIAICCFIGYAVVLLVVLIYILHTYIRQVDIYCGNKVIRQKGNKIIFELKYDNIKEIRQGYDSLFFVLKEPIRKTNGKKGPRNFYEHYSKTDIYRIKQIIANSNYNLNVN